MQFPDDLRYTREHEWIRANGNLGRVGITDHAQDQLGDVVYVNLPVVGSKLTQNQMFGDIDSVKTNSPLYAPASGAVVAINESVNQTPEVINRDPYGAGWLIEVELADPSELAALLSAEEYQATLGPQ